MGRKENQPPRLPARTSRESTPPDQEEKFVLQSNFEIPKNYQNTKFPRLFFQARLNDAVGQGGVSAV